ncbi:phosphatase PAP2 family protein [Sporolactobacillus sp. CQH2019]|uniref:phosphatase PAP2 family protein n=1 Tax=Sporolactobacillus sp. CQH2019 TaxID=3023512 RepID=UPI002367BE7B|nr:phosphatase PAP2 family protein [Sporolactobacillus sp. CQH2019]MDD9147313.1 phosphatase PAP2 family protein [Sporolactobacillus sp. CQH2019]
MKSRRQSVSGWLFVLALSVTLFLLLVPAVRTSAIRQADNALLQSLNPLRSAPMVAFFAELTRFGAGRLLFFIVAIGTAFLLYKRRYSSAVILPAAYLAERVLNTLLKNWIMRSRPPLPHLVAESGYSFPSGHAMNALTVYGLLILLLVPLIRSVRLKIVWTALCLIMILLIGFSRPLLRVHYFSDVFAGYCAGGAVVAACALIQLAIHAPARRDGG